MRAAPSIDPPNRSPMPSSPAATAPCSDSGAPKYVSRAAIALGVMPCSTSVTARALNTVDSCFVGSRPFSSRKATSPSDALPSSSSTRSCPRTTIRSAVDQAMSDFSFFAGLTVVHLPSGAARRLPTSGEARTAHGQLCLVSALAELSLGHELHLAPEHEPGVDRLGDLGGQLSVGVSTGRDLDLDRNRWRDGYVGSLANDSRAPRDARAKLAHDGQDRGRIHVHPSHDEHVVAASDAAHAEARALAAAGRPLDANDVTAEEPHDRHRLAGQARVNELSDCARLDLHRRASLRVDQLRPDVPGPAEMHALLVGALAEQRRRDVADAHDLGDRDAEHLLDVVANGGYAAAGLSPGDDVSHGHGARIRVG